MSPILLSKVRFGLDRPTNLDLGLGMDMSTKSSLAIPHLEWHDLKSVGVPPKNIYSGVKISINFSIRGHETVK